MEWQTQLPLLYPPIRTMKTTLDVRQKTLSKEEFDNDFKVPKPPIIDWIDFYKKERRQQ